MTFKLNGTLQQTPFATVLKRLAVGGASGVLTVKTAAAATKVFVDSGDILAVASSNATERLGSYLVGWRVLTEKDLHGLLARQAKANRGIGELAVAGKLLDRDELARILRIRAEDSILSLAQVRSGSYRFAERGTPTRSYIPVRLAIAEFLERLGRVLREAGLEAEHLPTADDVPVLIGETAGAGMPPEDLRVLAAVNGARTVAEVALYARVSRLQAVTSLHRAAQRKLIDLSAPKILAVPDSIGGWRHCVLEAEASLSFGDLADAYTWLGRLVEKAPRSRDAQEAALGLETRIREALTISPDSRLQGVMPPPDQPQPDLSSEEQQVLQGCDGIRRFSDVVSMLSGDTMTIRVTADSLLRQGLLEEVDATDLPTRPSG